jgi:hypothetical protein
VSNLCQLVNRHFDCEISGSHSDVKDFGLLVYEVMSFWASN